MNDTMARVVALHEQGKSTNDIVRIIHRSRQTVEAYIRIHKNPAKRSAVLERKLPVARVLGIKPDRRISLATIRALRTDIDNARRDQAWKRGAREILDLLLDERKIPGIAVSPPRPRRRR